MHRTASLLALSFILPAGHVASCAEEKPAVIAAKDAAKFVGRDVALEMTVRGAKNAGHRKKWFLSSEANFRSPTNVAVAIDHAAGDRFRAAGIDDPTRHYAGKRIHVTGKAVVEEDQVRVVVDAPEQIEIVRPGDPARPITVTIEDTFLPKKGNRGRGEAPAAIEFSIDDRKPIRIAAEDLAKLARRTASLPESDEEDAVKSRFEGCSLTDLLKAQGVKFGKELRGEWLTKYVLVEAADGYRALFSLTELDAADEAHAALLVDRIDDQPLPAAHGPLRLIVPADRRHGRWMKQVTKVRVASAAE